MRGLVHVLGKIGHARGAPWWPTTHPTQALSLEHVGSLRAYTATMLEQMLQAPGLVRGLASIESATSTRCITAPADAEGRE